MKIRAFLLALLIIYSGCHINSERVNMNFGDDVEFLKEHTNVVVLKDPSEMAQVAVVPEYQGRVMTSTTGGEKGMSYGWINYDLIESGNILQYMNPYGGEDRFWLGPEGGQYSIFFKNGSPFDLEHWFTPKPIDTEPFELISSSDDEAVFQKRMTVENYSETIFELNVDRSIRLLNPDQVSNLLQVSIPENVRLVGFASENKITNAGTNAWKEENGLLSIWILGMFKPSKETTVMIPFKNNNANETIVNDAYFGRVPEDRLKISNNIVYFSGDGEYRSKIGLPPERAEEYLASYDAVNQVLTIVHYNKPANENRYVNSTWEIQENPYQGDVVNSYNDGPPEPGATPLGPFYELETSSPAAALAPGESITHIHRTIHLSGDVDDLNEISRQLFDVSLEQVNDIF